MTLYFYMPSVTLLIQHAKKSNLKYAALDQISGAKFPAKSNAGIPPGLILVKDETIYLMPNAGLYEGQTAVAAGLVCKPIGSQTSFNAHFEEQVQNEIGEDDILEFINLDRLSQELQTRKDGYLAVRISRGDFEFAWLGEDLLTRKDGYFMSEVTEEEMANGWTNRR